MGELNYELLYRILVRCHEIRDEEGMKANVVRVYDGVLKDKASTYVEAHQAVTKAESANRKENKEADEALLVLDKPYKEVRTEVLAWVPTAVLPETLKALHTDTDKLTAIEALLDVIDEHGKEPWAVALLAGDFATTAAKTVKEINEAIASDKALASAKLTRAAAHGPAYEAHLPFKRVVREALGPTSKQYRRIHVRGSSAKSDDAPEEPKGNVGENGSGAGGG